MVSGLVCLRILTDTVHTTQTRHLGDSTMRPRYARCDDLGRVTSLACSLVAVPPPYVDRAIRCLSPEGQGSTVSSIPHIVVSTIHVQSKRFARERVVHLLILVESKG